MAVLCLAFQRDWRALSGYDRDACSVLELRYNQRISSHSQERRRIVLVRRSAQREGGSSLCGIARIIHLSPAARAHESSTSKNQAPAILAMRPLAHSIA